MTVVRDLQTLSGTFDYVKDNLNPGAVFICTELFLKLLRVPLCGWGPLSYPHNNPSFLHNFNRILGFEFIYFLRLIYVFKDS